MRRAKPPLIVGSGIAGLYVALRARELGVRPTVVTKSRLEESNTRYAQGGIAAAIGPDDSAELHLADTVRAGDGLVDRRAARRLTRDAPARIADLVRYGVPFDTVEGQIALGREAAHSRARILHAGGDATGLQIEETLRRRVTDAGIETRERRVLRALRPSGRRAMVAILSDPLGRQTEEVEAGPVVLATGGAGSLFRESSNPSIATGEGVAIAFRAGARVADMEFIQFHPTAFYQPGSPRFLITEALRGEGATLVDGQGRRFLPDYHPSAELAPRDVVARAIRRELQRSGAPCVFLDATALPRAQLWARFPTICRFLSEHGIDPSHRPIPVAPVAHYMIGGVVTDLEGRSSLGGLLACGEVAATGVHGANRLGSNSLQEGLVFGERVARQLARPIAGAPVPSRRQLRLREIHGAGARGGTEVTARIRDLLWEQVGIARDGAGLAAALDVLRDLRASLEPTDPGRVAAPEANQALLALLIATAARAREESRGAHFRSDFPTARPIWRQHLELALR
jgi:L-aspartate oxidase